MSETLQVGLAAEGITDYHVIESIIESVLGERSFDLKLLQPEDSVAFMGSGAAGALGGGWRGVYKWCLQASSDFERISEGPALVNLDLLIIHLDADVAKEDPANNPIAPIPALRGKLPCAQPCPSARATTDALRAVILSWLGETSTPAQIVLCTPSMNTEAWVMQLLCPNDSAVRSATWECFEKPERRLPQQSLSQRFTKSGKDYSSRRPGMVQGWPVAVAKLSEAARFEQEFRASIA